MKHHNFGYADRLGIAISVNGKRFKERLRKEFSEGKPASEDILEVFSAMLEGAQKKWNIPDDFTVMMNKHYFTLEEALKQAENKPLAYRKELVQIYSQLGLNANHTGIGNEHSAVNKSQFCKTERHLNASSLRLGPEGFECHINANFNPNEPRDKDGKWTTGGDTTYGGGDGRRASAKEPPSNFNGGVSKTTHGVSKAPQSTISKKLTHPYGKSLKLKPGRTLSSKEEKSSSVPYPDPADGYPVYGPIKPSDVPKKVVAEADMMKPDTGYYIVVGRTRALKGNPRNIGKVGGFDHGKNDQFISKGSAAVAPESFVSPNDGYFKSGKQVVAKGKKVIDPYRKNIKGKIVAIDDKGNKTGEAVFSGFHDVMGAQAGVLPELGRTYSPEGYGSFSPPVNNVRDYLRITNPGVFPIELNDGVGEFPGNSYVIMQIPKELPPPENTIAWPYNSLP